MLSDKLNLETGSFNIETSEIKSSLIQVYQDLNLKHPVYIHLLDDDELKEVNSNALQHDYYTDIITFDYRDDEDLSYAELLISYDRVVENSKTYNVTILTELSRVIIHGMLHLCGYDDKTIEEKKTMTHKENYYLAKHCST